MGGKGNRAVRSAGRKPANVFAGREVGEGGRARRRRRKRTVNHGKEGWNVQFAKQQQRCGVLVDQEG